jgi:RNA polymerase sigma factor (sigma-70 family)
MTETRDHFTVYIVDDDAAVRDSLSLLLSLRGYRTAVFACAEDFLRTHTVESAGSLIVDIKMPGMSGLELQAELAARGARLPVVIITAHGNVAAARTAFKTEAVDFLEKPFDDDQLVSAIEASFARERARLDARAQNSRRHTRLAALSEREREVMRLLVIGLHNRTIGEKLEISARTVEVHKARIMQKLGIRNLAELIRAADTDSR